MGKILMQVRVNIACVNAAAEIDSLARSLTTKPTSTLLFGGSSKTLT